MVNFIPTTWPPEDRHVSHNPNMPNIGFVKQEQDLPASSSAIGNDQQKNAATSNNFSVQPANLMGTVTGARKYNHANNTTPPTLQSTQNTSHGLGQQRRASHPDHDHDLGYYCDTDIELPLTNQDLNPINATTSQMRMFKLQTVAFLGLIFDQFGNIVTLEEIYEANNRTAEQEESQRMQGSNIYPNALSTQPEKVTQNHGNNMQINVHATGPSQHVVGGNPNGMPANVPFAITSRQHDSRNGQNHMPVNIPSNMASTQRVFGDNQDHMSTNVNVPFGMPPNQLIVPNSRFAESINLNNQPRDWGFTSPVGTSLAGNNIASSMATNQQIIRKNQGYISNSFYAQMAVRDNRYPLNTARFPPSMALSHLSTTHISHSRNSPFQFNGSMMPFTNGGHGGNFPKVGTTNYYSPTTLQPNLGDIFVFQGIQQLQTKHPQAVDPSSTIDSGTNAVNEHSHNLHTIFVSFPIQKLPLELQRMVYTFMFPDARSESLDLTRNPTQRRAAEQNLELPITLRICGVSRQLTLEKYYLIHKTVGPRIPERKLYGKVYNRKGADPNKLSYPRPFCYNPNIDTLCITYDFRAPKVAKRLFNEWYDKVHRILAERGSLSYVGLKGVRFLDVRDVVVGSTINTNLSWFLPPVYGDGFLSRFENLDKLYFTSPRTFAWQTEHYPFLTPVDMALFRNEVINYLKSTQSSHGGNLVSDKNIIVRGYEAPLGNRAGWFPNEWKDFLSKMAARVPT